MALKPQLPKKTKTPIGARDLKAKKNPKGGAQKKEGPATEGLTKTGPGRLQF